MLRKLLKYDIKSVLRSWIVMGIMSIVLSAVSGICLSISLDEKNAELIAPIIFTVLPIFVVMIISVVPFVTSFIRFYQNLFTDEGYLTFTLPVKKQDILLSKLLFTFVSAAHSAVIVGIDVIIFILLSGVYKGGGEESVAEFDPMIPLYILLGFIIALLVIVAVTLFVFIMITIASKYSKTGRSFFAIAVMYAVGTLFSAAMISLTNLSTGNALGWSDVIPPDNYGGALALLMLTVCAFLATLSVLLYIAEYRLLDKHLNLS